MIAWGVTGAGRLLEESVERVEELAEEHDVTVFLSGAAEEVLVMYGLLDRLEGALSGEYLNEIFRQSESGKSYSKAGRFALGKYDCLVVSPCTSNTSAKMVSGISDNLVTNAFAQAGKAGVRTYVVPVDLEGSQVSETPHRVLRELCEECDECPPAEECPEGAFDRTGGTQIDLEKCIACGICVELCPYGAVSGGEDVWSKARKIDIRNAEELREFEGVALLSDPREFIP